MTLRSIVAAFDGTHYLGILKEGNVDEGWISKAIYYDLNFQPIGEFIISEPSDSLIPLTFVSFRGTKYLAITTVVDSSFDSGKVYGVFLGAGIDETAGSQSFSLPDRGGVSNRGSRHRP